MKQPFFVPLVGSPEGLRPFGGWSGGRSPPAFPYASLSSPIWLTTIS
jgi:hypothetical protein